jgi:O-antigen/teichoic acid export membrane protein
LKFKGLLSIGFTDVIGTGISAIFWFFMATLIDPEDFGEISYFMGIASIGALISLIGTQNTIVVYVAKKIKVQSILNIISLVIGGISLILIITIFDRIDAGFLLLAFVISTLAIGDLLGRNFYNSYSKYFLIQKSLLLVLGFGFYYLFGIEGIIAALAISHIGYIIRIIKVFNKSEINFSLLKPRIGFITNNYVVALLNGAKSHTGKLIIAPLLGFSLLGNYALALQVIALMGIITTILFKYTLSQDAAGKRNNKLKQITLLISVLIAIISYILAPIIIPEVFPKYLNAIIAIQIMSFSIIPITITTIYTSKFLGLGNSKYVLYTKITSIITIIVGTIILGSNYGIIGLSFAYLLSATIEALLFMLINIKVKEK